MVNFCRHTMLSLKNYFCNLNFFEEPSDSNEREDEQKRYQNIIVTRVYLFILIFVLIGISIFTCLTYEIIIVTLNYPSKNQLNDLPPDANCPCSQISLSYGDFISIQPIFHQVCSSDFISDRWIEAIFSGSNSTYFYSKDFRTFGSAQFQALAGFCRLSKSNLQQNVDSFDQSSFISSQVHSETVFQQEIQSAIAQFQQTAPQIFATQLELISKVSASNELVSGLQTNYILSYGTYDTSATAVQYYRNDGTSCNCLLGFNCTSDAGFNTIFGASTQYIFDSMQPLLGISSGCLPVNSILASTLECLYNQTCLNDLISFFSTSEQFIAMEDTDNSSFGPYATVQSMVNNLMVEDWIINVSYEKYYDICAPLSCTYSKVERHGLVSVVTKLISLLSGLTLLLQVFIPIIVRFIFKRLNRIQSPKMTLCARLQVLITKLKKLIVKLNIFKHYPSNDRQIRYQRYATRFYICSLIISVGILAQYNLVNKSVHRTTILNPTESQYIELEQTYPDGLTCPCTSISMSYSTFFTIQAQYHQLCSSYLITSQWITYSNSMVNIGLYILDYRFYAGLQFQTLAMLCDQAQNTIDEALGVFLQTQFVSSKVIDQQLFQSEMTSLFENWNSSTTNQFVRMIQLIGVTTQANQLMNRLDIYYYYDSVARQITVGPRTYNGCSCAFSRTCYDSMDIYSYEEFPALIVVFTVPNFFVGCYLFEALLLSTMECFYDVICMSELNVYFNSSLIESLSFPALNASLNSPTETMESITNRLMVDAWLWNASFASYYKTCAPTSCTVEYITRNDLFAVITIIIGIFGGLSIGFKMLIWLGLRLIEKFISGFSVKVSLHYIKYLLSCSNEQQQIRRLHFILATVTLYTIYIYYVFSPQLIVVETQKPTLAVYEDLVSQYPDSLQCSCSEISIQYQSFLSITASFHPACSRNFVAEEWIASQNIPPDVFAELPLDYIYSAMGQLQAIDSLCAVSQSTVNDSLDQLLTSHLVNTQLLSSSLLTNQIQTTIDDFRNQVPKSLINTFSLTRETTNANKFMTTFGTGWVFDAPPSINIGFTAHTVPVDYQGCNCGLTSSCVTNLNGILIGCYVLEALLQSTLECLYDQECLDSTHTFPPLNNSIDPSRFPINSTYELVFSELMIEEIFTNLSYNNYFYQCAPSSCVHSYLDQSNLMEGITVLIPLYGGIVIICQLVAVIIVKLLQRRSARVASAIN